MFSDEKQAGEEGTLAQVPRECHRRVQSHGGCRLFECSAPPPPLHRVASWGRQPPPHRPLRTLSGLSREEGRNVGQPDRWLSQKSHGEYAVSLTSSLMVQRPQGSRRAWNGAGVSDGGRSFWGLEDTPPPPRGSPAGGPLFQPSENQGHTPALKGSHIPGSKSRGQGRHMEWGVVPTGPGSGGASP